MTTRNPRDLYVEQLHDLYSAETQLVEALPKMAKAATNSNSKRPSRNIWPKPKVMFSA